MSIAIRLLRKLATLQRAEGGNAGIEFSIAAPVLVAMLVPITDLGMGIYQQMQVRDAAQAGAQYAMAHGWDSAAIQAAVTSATTLSGLAASPAPTRSCGCPGQNGIDSAACGATCQNGKAAGVYVTVNAQATYTPLVPYPTLGSSLALNAQTTARIQ